MFGIEPKYQESFMKYVLHKALFVICCHKALLTLSIAYRYFLLTLFGRYCCKHEIFVAER